MSVVAVDARLRLSLRHPFQTLLDHGGRPVHPIDHGHGVQAFVARAGRIARLARGRVGLNALELCLRDSDRVLDGPALVTGLYVGALPLAQPIADIARAQHGLALPGAVGIGIGAGGVRAAVHPVLALFVDAQADIVVILRHTDRIGQHQHQRLVGRRGFGAGFQPPGGSVIVGRATKARRRQRQGRALEHLEQRMADAPRRRHEGAELGNACLQRASRQQTAHGWQDALRHERLAVKVRHAQRPCRAFGGAIVVEYLRVPGVGGIGQPNIGLAAWADQRYQSRGHIGRAARADRGGWVRPVFGGELMRVLGVLLGRGQLKQLEIGAVIMTAPQIPFAPGLVVDIDITLAQQARHGQGAFALHAAKRRIPCLVVQPRAAGQRRLMPFVDHAGAHQQHRKVQPPALLTVRGVNRVGLAVQRYTGIGHAADFH
ncbi:Uncharacterised protein [Achromobacter xylosoxidans]|nr:Uncharacterised protein [Achromobacter xylosoxidans]